MSHITELARITILEISPAHSVLLINLGRRIYREGYQEQRGRRSGRLLHTLNEREDLDLLLLLTINRVQLETRDKRN